MPKYSFKVNGYPVTVDGPADLPLLWALRDKLHVTGPKYGCGVSLCRACTCLLDGEEVTTCSVKLEDVQGREVTTIEGLANGDELHPVQEAWLEEDVPQCGFCQPGQIMAAVALLERTRQGRRVPVTDDDIDGIQNVCRCGTYVRIREAIKNAAEKMEQRPPHRRAGR